MKAIPVLLLCFLVTIFANGQSIKIKIAGVTAAAGEDVIAFEVSDTTGASVNGGGGQSTPVPSFEFVKIKKLKDVSTNELFKRSMLGTHTANVTFEFYDATSTLFYTIVLLDVTINHFSYLTPECAGCTKMYHQVWLDYVKIESTDVSTGLQVRYNRTTRATY